MRLNSINVIDVVPIKKFEVNGLSDVVVLAGPNGVGKTRLLNGIINHFRQSGHQGQISCKIEATSETEENAWGKQVLHTEIPEDRTHLTTTLQKVRTRSNWESTVLSFESNRAFERVEPLAFDWNYADPFTEAMAWDFLMRGMRDRFKDVTHAMFRKIRSRREQMARSAEQQFNAAKNGAQKLANIATISEKDFPDPLSPFKSAFQQLLAPKRLIDPEIQQQQLMYEFEGQELPLSELSSGEREVVNITFDFILRNPKDSIIIFDEPELHLHPELSYKLIQTLRNIGPTNQFIFCTHSSDIITASLESSVIFISPPTENGNNQAIPVREDDKTNQALHRLGQSVGIISLGRRIVLIEGSHTSLDKQAYGAILQDQFPNLVLAPSGGKSVVRAFSSLVESVLKKVIWGVDFFMVCDGDTIPINADRELLEEKSGQRLRILPRYHLENFFLDENVIAKIFKDLEPVGSWLRDPPKIRDVLRQIATDMVTYTVALSVSGACREEFGNLDTMPKGCDKKNLDELKAAFVELQNGEKERLASILDESAVSGQITALNERLTRSIMDDTDEWKSLIPGKQIVSRFAAQTKLDVARFKQSYLTQARKMDMNPFEDVISIFSDFSSFEPTS